jgi:hypothetical protein
VFSPFGPSGSGWWWDGDAVLSGEDDGRLYTHRQERTMPEPENTSRKQPSGDAETRGIPEVAHVAADLAAVAMAAKALRDGRPPKPPEKK